MKKLSFVLVFVLLLQLCSVSAFATVTKHVKITELDMELDIPADYIVFTRDIDSNDKNLKKYGLTKSGLLKQFEDGNIYLDALDNGAQHEITVTMIDSILGDYNLYSDTTLLAMSSAAKSLFNDLGYDTVHVAVQQEKQAKFIVYTLQNTSEKKTCIEYNTVYADKTINVSFFMYSDDGDNALFRNGTALDTIDSVIFGTAPKTRPAPEYTPSFEYKDSKTGASFTVPEYWVEKPLSKEREFIDVKFGCNKEDGLSIMYGSSDLWGEMTNSERAGMKRSECDNSIITDKDLAALSGTGIGNVQRVTYNGKEYFQYTQQGKQNIYGLDIDVSITALSRVENGYMYQFQFFGTPDNPYYKDFEELVSSIKYPAVSEGLNGAAIASIVFAVVALVLVFVLFLIKRNEKKNAAAVSDSPSEVPVSKPLNTTIEFSTGSAESMVAEDVRFCTQCGQKIPADSKFCPFCGSNQSK